MPARRPIGPLNTLCRSYLSFFYFICLYNKVHSSSNLRNREHNLLLFVSTWLLEPFLNEACYAKWSVLINLFSFCPNFTCVVGGSFAC